MKIAFSIPHMSLGGAQRVCYNLIIWLQNNTDSEIFLIIYSSNITGGVDFDLSAINHVYVDGNFQTRIKKERKVLKEFNPDVLVSFGVPNAIFDIPASNGLGMKRVVCERNDPAHFGGSNITKLLSRTLMRCADAYVFQTRDAQLFYGGNMAKHSVVIPNPLFNTEHMPSHFIGEDREKTIVTAGRLNKQKNHPLLLRAFKNVHEKHPDYRLVIYGEGPERYHDEQLIKELSLRESVSLPGATTNVYEKLYKKAMFVLSSDFEGMPNALMEAMALGLPCISTDCPCGGPRDLIINGNNGLLVPVGDEKKMTDAMLTIIENEEVANSISTLARKVRNSYSMDIIAKKWLRFLENL